MAKGPGDVRTADGIRALTSVLAVGLPLLERQYDVLPVAERVREAALPAAVLATLLCVIAGYATSRQSVQGLQVGWTSLALFLAVVVALFGFMDLIPRGDRALYILCFALFGLSAASFLSIRQAPPADDLGRATPWQ
jgi:hypothetical protein